MLVPLAYRLLVTVLSRLGMLSRSSASKGAEILALGHEVAVQRRVHPKPKLSWSERTRRSYPDASEGPAIRAARDAGHAVVLTPTGRAAKRRQPNPPGRPPLPDEAAGQVVRLAWENRTSPHQVVRRRQPL